MSITNQKILFLGPSAVALDGFDYSVMDNYDYIARTNFFLHRDDLDEAKNRCDIIFLNYFSSKHYCLDKIDNRLFGKKIFTKTNDEAYILSEKYPESECESIQDTILEIKENNDIKVPYIGTSSIFHLIKNYNQVDIAGVDFYLSGFGSDGKYIEKYPVYCESNSEQDSHDIKKDMLFLAKIYLLNKGKMNFLHKSKKIIDDFINEKNLL